MIACTPETIREMRDWIADCVWQDLHEDEVDDLTDEQVVRGVARHYCGGVAAFIADNTVAA